MVILSVCHNPVLFQNKLRQRLWYSPFDSLVSLVFRDKISCHWVKRVHMNEGAKEGHPPKKTLYRYCIRTVAPRN